MRRIRCFLFTAVGAQTRSERKQVFCVLPLVSSSGGRAGQPVPLAPFLHHLRRLGAGGGPVVHAQRHQLPAPPDSLPLQCKSCLTSIHPLCSNMPSFPLPGRSRFPPTRSSRSLSAAAEYMLKTSCGCCISACLAACQVTLPLCVVIFIFSGHYRPLCTTSLTSPLVFPSVPSLHLLRSLFLSLPSVPRRSGGGEAKEEEREDRPGLSLACLRPGEAAQVPRPWFV